MVFYPNTIFHVTNNCLVLPKQAFIVYRSQSKSPVKAKNQYFNLIDMAKFQAYIYKYIVDYVYLLNKK